MQRFYESVINKDEIDGLDHLSTRYYSVKAGLARDRLLEALGFSGALQADCTAFAKDSLIRFHREQRLGTNLVVNSGIVSASPDELLVYSEIIDGGTQTLAATVTERVVLQDARTRAPRTIPPGMLANAAQHMTAWPAHGQPRSLDFSPLAREPQIEEFGVQDHAMNLDFVVPRGSCDAHGYLVCAMPQELFQGKDWRPRTQLKFESPDGELGWVQLELRFALLSTPRAGDSIVSRGADITLAGQKLRYWCVGAYNADTRALIGFRVSCVSMFDMRTRKSAPIPPHIRAEFERRTIPALYPFNNKL